MLLFCLRAFSSWSPAEVWTSCLRMAFYSNNTLFEKRWTEKKFNPCMVLLSGVMYIVLKKCTKQFGLPTFTSCPPMIDSLHQHTSYVLKVQIQKIVSTKRTIQNISYMMSLIYDHTKHFHIPESTIELLKPIYLNIKLILNYHKMFERKVSKS